MCVTHPILPRTSRQLRPSRPPRPSRGSAVPLAPARAPFTTRSVASRPAWGAAPPRPPAWGGAPYNPPSGFAGNPGSAGGHPTNGVPEGKAVTSASPNPRPPGLADTARTATRRNAEVRGTRPRAGTARTATRSGGGPPDRQRTYGDMPERGGLGRRRPRPGTGDIPDAGSGERRPLTAARRKVGRARPAADVRRHAGTRGLGSAPRPTCTPTQRARSASTPPLRGAGSGTRTRKPFRADAFEAPVYADSTIPARRAPGV